MMLDMASEYTTRYSASVCLAVWATILAAFGLPGSPVAESGVTSPKVVVTARDCRRLVRHVPSAEYKPGVDVRGRPVAPADVPGSRQIKIPDRFEFDITVKVYEAIGAIAPKGLGDTNLTVGRVAIDAMGAVTFNGEPLGDAAEAAIAEACRELLARGVTD
jgi:hypothetical protein